MSLSKLEIQGHSIVFVGSFNPAIFQPAWFSHENLIREAEAEQANIEIIRREIVSFSTDKFRIEVLPERMLLATTQNSFYEPLRDLALGTFRTLRHTPITNMGINRDFHFKVESESTWHAIGDKLAPKDLWDSVLTQPGLKGLTIQGKRPDEYHGAIFVRAEPSTKVHPGIFININDHYDLENAPPGHGAEEMLEIFENSWKNSIERSEYIAKKVVEF